MRMRAAACVALVGAVVTGLTGCEFFAPQQTTRSYSASDGVNGSVGPVDIRNAFLVTVDGTDASLIVSLINSSATARSVSMQYNSASGVTTQSVVVPANASLAVRPGEPVTVTFSGLTAKTGSLLPVFFSSGGTSDQLGVPVLDNTLPGYATLTPSPTPTPTPTKTKKPSDGESPSPTDTADPLDTPTPTPTP
ncbi:DNA modification methylase [uncultured Amnibacterium sp.]|uniref:DNA modification methylase n=1 Tax=uncultured Amnibacterium sp. TaxID=1631851 RepID=UPI0035C974E4